MSSREVLKEVHRRSGHRPVSHAWRAIRKEIADYNAVYSLTYLGFSKVDVFKSI